MKDTQTLKFYWLKYEVSAIQDMINNNPGIDNFVFCYYFPETENPGKQLQLIAYGHMDAEDPVKASYSKYYDTLEVYKNHALEVGGPLIMSNNIISVADMEALINTTGEHNDKPEYLVFKPGIQDSGYIYYDIIPYSRHTGKDSELPTGPVPVNTNPSPPATIY
ncbi:MAG TPA: hypothetical protein VGC08_01075 [Pedobacter sp.]